MYCLEKMNSLFCLLMFFPCVFSFTLMEEEFIYSCTQHTGTKRVIVEADDQAVSVVKKLSSRKVFVAAWTSEQIINHWKLPIEPGVYQSHGRVLYAVSPDLLKKLFRVFLSIERLEEATSLHASVDRSFHTWLSFWPDHRDVVNTTRIRFDTEVLIAKSIDSQGVIHVKTIYDVNGVQFAFHWGDWSLEKGLEVSFDNSQRLLSGVRVSRLFIDPKAFDDQRSIQSVLEVNDDIVTGLASLLNFTFAKADTSTRDFEKADMWDTMAMLRPPYIGSVVPFAKVKMSMYLKELGYNQVENYFIHPFHRDLWLSICGWILVAMLAGGIVEMARERPALIENVASVLEAFCSQGGSWVDSCLTARMQRIFVWITVMIILQSYTAIIIAFVTARHAIVPFTSVEGLAKDGRYKLSMKAKMIHLVAFMERPDLAAHANKILVPTSEFPNDMHEAAAQVCKGGLVFLSSNDAIMKIPNSCSIMKIKNSVFEFFMAVFLSLKSQFARPFTSLMANFWSGGLMARYQRIMDDTDSNNEKVEFMSVEFELISDMHFILIYGAVISIVIFILEIVIAFIKRRKRVCGIPRRATRRGTKTKVVIKI